MTDPIADMLTRIRNKNQNRDKLVSMPTSKMKEQIAKILKEEGFIEEFKEEDKTITLTLKYANNKERVITGLKRISNPGLRVYAKASEIPTVLNGLGIAIISTPNGVITDKEARKNIVGGEVIAYIW